MQEYVPLMGWEILAWPENLDSIEVFTVLDASLELCPCRPHFGLPEERHIARCAQSDFPDSPW